MAYNKFKCPTPAGENKKTTKWLLNFAEEVNKINMRFKDELKKAFDRFEEKELVIERNPELFSVAIIITKNKS
ncbi:MAG: hypothetical protein AB1606_02850 [Nitrospirota bacterium]